MTAVLGHPQVAGTLDLPQAAEAPDPVPAVEATTREGDPIQEIVAG